MLKRINPSQVELGMFIHKLEGSWFKHPFWKSRFLLEDDATLDDLRDSDVCAVVIDLSKGRDIAPSQPAEIPQTRLSRYVRPDRGKSVQRRVFVPPAPVQTQAVSPQTFTREFGQARSAATRARKVVSRVFLEARLGKSVDANEVEPVIEEIFASVQRNPHAFNGLMRCKRDAEHVYRHALACSALMISLARRMKFSPAQIREAGMAGLLFDVGVSHLPVGDDRGGDDYRALPLEVRSQGYNFLIASGIPEKIALVALQHHERADGSGYPNRLTGVKISPLARMAAVCDAYDLLVSGAPGVAPLDPADAVQRLVASSGQFDPETLLALMETVGAYPVGSFVELRSKRLAMVVDQDPADTSRPKVRVFWSLALGKKVRQTEIRLAECYGEDEIVGIANLDMFTDEEAADLRQRLLEASVREN